MELIALMATVCVAVFALRTPCRGPVALLAAGVPLAGLGLTRAFC